MSQQPALVIPFYFFRRTPSNTLYKTSFDLANINVFVERITDIMQNWT